MRLAAVLAGLVMAGAAAAAERPVVVDGDTLRINGQRVRLYGIDAPERHQLCRRSDGSWDCGAAAAQALASIIGDRPVTCEPVDYDRRYKRQVSICRAGDEDLGAWLVRNGWAVAYTRYSSRYVPEETMARLERRGIWAGEFDRPENWRAARR